jgi:hypothetical protein
MGQAREGPRFVRRFPTRPRVSPEKPSITPPAWPLQDLLPPRF